MSQSRRHTPTPQYVAAVGMRLSSKADHHDSRPNRERTRAAAKRAAEREW